MKASRLQYFFAGNWPSKIWVFGGPWLCVIATGISLRPISAYFGDWFSALTFVGIVCLALILGYFVSILSGTFVLGPLYYNRSLKNGEPFHEGDVVQILVGPYRDRVAKVYKVWDLASWAGAHRVRVDLGEKEKTESRDVFSSYQIFRIVNFDKSSSSVLAAVKN